MEEFINWYCSEPRLALNRIVVLRFRLHLRGISPPRAESSEPSAGMARPGATESLRMSFGTWSKVSLNGSSWTISRHTIFAERALGSPATRKCKQRRVDVRLATSDPRFNFQPADACIALSSPARIIELIQEAQVGFSFPPKESYCAPHKVAF
jgi:hypothetical protein